MELKIHIQGDSMDNNIKLTDTNTDYPVANIFSDGVYARTIFMPKGHIVIGKKHKTRHLNFIMTGKAWVWMNGEKKYYEAPCIVESFENVRKVLYIEEDMYWTTVHITDIVDPDEAVEMLTVHQSDEEVVKELQQEYNFSLENIKEIEE